jgi:hypothetical protein
MAGRIDRKNILRGEKSKAIPVTGPGGLEGCDMLSIPHTVYTISPQMAARLSTLCTGCALLPRNIIFLLLILISVRG